MAKETLLVFPNQLFADHPGRQRDLGSVVLIEDSLFFGDSRYPAAFHKQKLWLHRASMQRYAQEWKAEGYSVEYREHDPGGKSWTKTLRAKAPKSKGLSVKRWCCVDPVDFVLKKRMQALAGQMGVQLTWLPNPGFLNTPEINHEYRETKNRWFMADFYKAQRLRMNLMLDDDQQPVGGQWSFDADNRKKIAKADLKQIPQLTFHEPDAIDREAKQHVLKIYATNPGHLETLYYPTSHAGAKRWLQQFLKQRLGRFGDYEDAMEPDQIWLWHGVLTPMMNIGLLTPSEVLQQTLGHAAVHEVPLNSLEGFVRQIVGWREFMRATYEDLGVTMRTTNHWQHRRQLPDAFYTGTTGIDPVDRTIHRLLETGYCHHIERLMVLGGFLFLCEIDPDDVYRWFMEMFVDSYDWVMVPNVYAMSQHADGGLITTKPYFSGSAYIRKMSHYPAGEWCKVWDGLYWRWISLHADGLADNPRWAMMVAMARKMDRKKMQDHVETAEAFLSGLR